ncbi:hypothetical protein [Streptomyces sp. NBC_00728]
MQDHAAAPGACLGTVTCGYGYGYGYGQDSAAPPWRRENCTARTTP